MKHIKMLIYGEPGVGKSVFASKAPNPYFITTDGNYEFLEEFGAKPEAHTQVNTWSEAKKLFASDTFDNYDTIIIDLLEDLFKWCEYEYCVRNRIDHVSDVGYGKGYDASRNEFFIEICKLLGLEKNIILIMHGISFVVKDRRGVEHQKYAPSSRLPDKVLDMIEGRVRYCLRCYLKDEEQQDGTLIKKRFLSLVPKPNEFGIIRGVNENSIPHDIPLDFKCFADVIGLDTNVKSEKPKKVTKTVAKEEKKDSIPVKEEEKVKQVEEPKQEVKEEKEVSLDVENVQAVEETQPVEDIAETSENADKPAEDTSTQTSNEVSEEESSKSEPDSAPAPAPEINNNDKLAAIRAKLAAINAKK